MKSISKKPIFLICLLFIFSSLANAETISLISNADVSLTGVSGGEPKFGTSVAKGDINNDGIDDLIVGAPGEDPKGKTNAGQTFVFFGGTNFNGTISASNADVILNGIDAEDDSGGSVGSGDFNGDGISDIIIGAPGVSDVDGEAYVVFGSNSISGEINLSTGADVKIDLFGDNNLDVGSVDINNDGYDDILIGARRATSKYPSDKNIGGRTYIIFGSSGISGLIHASWDADIVYHGLAIGDYSGWSVSSGDVNGDSIDDAIIGAPGADPNGNSGSGSTYIIFGSNNPDVGNVSLADANVTLNGIDATDYSGKEVSLGDVNGDSIDDAIIGTPQADRGGQSNAGETYVVFGGNSLSSTINLNTGADITIIGDLSNDRSGQALSTGDFNDDGYNDIMIMAYGDNVGYVVFGGITGTVDLRNESDIDIIFTHRSTSTGTSVCSGDFNNDNIDDFVGGLAYTGSSVGTVYSVFASGPEWSVPTQNENYIADEGGQGTKLTNYNANTISSINNYVWHSLNNGKIKFKSPLDFSNSKIGDDNNLDNDIEFGDSFVSINSDTASVFSGKTANITFENISCNLCNDEDIYYSTAYYTNKDSIISNGEPCSDSSTCTSFSCTNPGAVGDCTFDITGFSGYAVNDSDTLNINDSVEGSSADVDASITFYAYYESGGISISGASCNATFDDNPGTSYTMGWDSGLSAYTYTKSSGFSSAGTHDWNVTCAKSGYSTLTASDTVSVSSGVSAVPEFSDYAIMLLLITVVGGFFYIKRNEQFD